MSCMMRVDIHTAYFFKEVQLLGLDWQRVLEVHRWDTSDDKISYLHLFHLLLHSVPIHHRSSPIYER